MLKVTYTVKEHTTETKFKALLKFTALAIKDSILPYGEIHNKVPLN